MALLTALFGSSAFTDPGTPLSTLIAIFPARAPPLSLALGQAG